MFKKSVFSKIFLINIVTVLVGIIVLTILQYTLTSKYIASEREASLRRNAKSIASIINNEASFENLKLVLDSFARSSNNQIIIIDRNRKILIFTGADNGGETKKDYIESEYTKDVFDNKENVILGNLGGIFGETMFTLQIPITDVTGSTVVGAVFISTTVPEIRRMNQEILKISLFCMFLVVLVSFVLSYTLSMRISNPIKRIGKTAKSFAKGNFNERVEIEKSDYQISEITELADAFNNMAYELEKFEEIRMNFISDVSHELRTPMTTISGFIDGILDDTVPKERQSEYLKIIRDEIRRLAKLVNSFLDLTRMKSDKVAIEPVNFDINEVIRLTIISLERKIEDKKIEVNIEFPDRVCFVKADLDSIKRVLTNLIDNAIKFTNENGEIRIKVYAKQQDVFISIFNTGCGIPKDEQKFIFERFYKVDKSRSINKDGTGIGLYIVKNIISAHGREIHLISEEGKFAEFIFSLDKGRQQI